MVRPYAHESHPDGLPAMAGWDTADSSGELEASPIGELISLRGIGITSGMIIVSCLQRYRGFDRLSWFYFVLSLPDASVVSLYINRQEEESGCYHLQLSEYVRSATDASSELEKMASQGYILSDAQLMRLKGAFLLRDWVRDIRTAEIELKYRLHVGSMLQIAEGAGWLLDSTASIALLMNLPPQFVEKLRTLAVAVNSGFDLPDSILHEIGFSPEQRDLAWGLFDAGIASVSHFSDLHSAKITAVVGEKLAAELIEKFRQSNFSDNQSNQEVQFMSQLRLRGSLRGDRVPIEFNNTDIDLTPKSFNYLFKLTATRILKGDGWLSKDELEPGFNQAKNIYRVKQELKRFGTGLEERIENNKAGFYRINLLPQQIKIDFDSMKSIFDMELAELTKRLESCPVC